MTLPPPDPHPMLRLRGRQDRRRRPEGPLRGILFDRDGTLIADVPYLADPEGVRLLSGAEAAVQLARAHGLAVGVVTNQSGIGRRLFTARDAGRVADRVEQLLGHMDVWVTCPHAPAYGCSCRKPAPGGLLAASAALELPPSALGYVGDIGSDLEAARRAGMPAVLVPNDRTDPAEIARAPLVAADLLAAVRCLLAGEPEGRSRARSEADRLPG